MTPRQPAWRRALRRPLWQRERLPIAYSDFDPISPAIQAVNRGAEQLSDALDRGSREAHAIRELHERGARLKRDGYRR